MSEVGIGVFPSVVFETTVRILMLDVPIFVPCGFSLLWVVLADKAWEFESIQTMQIGM
jgi:hypothetical protein